MGKITIADIINKGLELPDERYDLYVGDFQEYAEDFKGVGGIYQFSHDTDGVLYIGVSSDLWKRISAHLNMLSTGNSKLQQKLMVLEDVVLTVFMEPNMSLREIYENYLILTLDPLCNVNKKNVDLEGQQYGKRLTKEEQEQKDYAEEMTRRMEMYTLYAYKNVTLEEIGIRFNEPPLRVKHLISPWLEENF